MEAMLFITNFITYISNISKYKYEQPWNIYRYLFSVTQIQIKNVVDIWKLKSSHRCKKNCDRGWQR